MLCSIRLHAQALFIWSVFALPFSQLPCTAAMRIGDSVSHYAELLLLQLIHRCVLYVKEVDSARFEDMVEFRISMDSMEAIRC